MKAEEGNRNFERSVATDNDDNKDVGTEGVAKVQE